MAAPYRACTRIRSSENSILTPDVAKGADILEGKRESNSALTASTEFELHPLQAQSVTVEIIANLADRLLEK